MNVTCELNLYDLDLLIGAMEMMAEYKEDMVKVNEDDGDDSMADEDRDELRDIHRIIGYMQTLAQNRMSAQRMPFSDN